MGIAQKFKRKVFFVNFEKGGKIKKGQKGSKF